MSGPSLVTIAIACFNARDTVGRAIASALAQDYPQIEVVVVDDCSTDGSPQLVADLIAAEPRARLVLHSQNLGPGGTRNTLLQEAKGVYVAFFDDDDEACPDRVRKQVETLLEYENQTHAPLVACYASGERHYPSGYVMALPAIGSKPIIPSGPGLADYLLFYGKTRNWHYGSGVPTAALLARRATFEAVAGFDQKLRRLEDVDFAIRLALAGGHFVGTDKSLFIQHATAGLDKLPEANRDAAIAVAEKHEAYLRSRGRYYYAVHWPSIRYWHFRRKYGRLAYEFGKIAFHNPIAAAAHIATTGPRRLLHEMRIRLGMQR